MGKSMKNPWSEIPLGDYEAHMRLASVGQLQALNAMMRGQLSRYDVSTVMILGIAGGNGLEHVDPAKYRTVYGVDVNAAYLTQCTARYPALTGIFRPVQADLQEKTTALPKAELLVANLLIEYIGYENFQRAVRLVRPRYISCGIQINTDVGFVSDSPYLHVFDGLEAVHHQMSEDGLTAAMGTADYSLIEQEETPLPNGKRLVRLDYVRL